MTNNAIHIALLTLDLMIPGSESLKSKRRVLQSLKERIRNKYNVAIAEVGELDKWQRSVIALTSVSNDHDHLAAMMSEVMKLAELQLQAQIIDSHLDFL